MAVSEGARREEEEVKSGRLSGELDHEILDCKRDEEPLGF